MTLNLSTRFPLRCVVATTAVLLGTVALLVFTTVSQGDDELDPEAVKEAAKQGYERADREVEKEKLEKAKSDGTLTKEQAERLKKIEDMDKDYENWKKNPFVNKKAVDVAERARQYRAGQYEVQELKSDTVMSHPYEIKAVENQLKKLKQGPPELPDPPPLPSSPTSVALSVVDECKKHLVMSSLGRPLPLQTSIASTSLPRNPLLHLVQTKGNPPKPSPSDAEPKAPAPPDPIETQAKAIVDRMSDDIRNQLGSDFDEYVDLQSMGAERTPAQETRLQDIATKIRNVVQGKKDEVKGMSSFSDPKLVGAILSRLDRF
ncbi:MAG: hypothetical protein ACRD2L_26280, partial [Terriglobia bacterium]